MDNSLDLVRVVEAILFSATEPLSSISIARIAKTSVKKVESALQKLIEEYSSRESAIEVVKLKDKYLMRVKPEYHKFIGKFVESDLDKGCLRTLAVIAINQPIELSKLAKIRGNRCYEHVKKLEELGFIKAEKKGRTKVLTTTKEFAVYFGLKTDKPEEIKEILKAYLS
jgi:segregation and condensation protein B